MYQEKYIPGDFCKIYKLLKEFGSAEALFEHYDTHNL